jgi:hypothetical protein
MENVIVAAIGAVATVIVAWMGASVRRVRKNTDTGNGHSIAQTVELIADNQHVTQRMLQDHATLTEMRFREVHQRIDDIARGVRSDLIR